MKITTTSGAVYLIDHGHWARFKNGHIVDGWWAVWDLKQSNDNLNLKEIGFQSPWEEGQTSWDDVSWTTPELLTPGRHMYIRGRETWWITTPVVSVEDEEDE